LATGKGFAGVISSTNKLFWTSSASPSSMTSFDADMTLYLCAGVYGHAGFQCEIDVLKVWPVYDESFLLSVLFGQTRNAPFLRLKIRLITLANPLFLYAMTETSGTSAANTYVSGTSATLGKLQIDIF
jgi:hypothetical protein